MVVRYLFVIHYPLIYRKFLHIYDRLGIISKYPRIHQPSHYDLYFRYHIIAQISAVRSGIGYHFSFFV